MDEVRLQGYRFSVIYKGIEYEVESDVCLDVFTHNIQPDPFDNGHTPMEIKEWVEEQFFKGKAIGLV